MLSGHESGTRAAHCMEDHDKENKKLVSSLYSLGSSPSFRTFQASTGVF